ncbi:MAG: LacI family DNA-binding transcriptional regulator [Anaerolineae bacterium]|nr:LacI family DNA-binding transcriptional regulator [Anaerolineae bacterium]
MAQKKRVTIQDIARKANVSKSTVSRVLNDTTPVAPEKETAVLAAIAELNYQPNIFARGLAGGQSLSIGALTQNIGSAFYDTIMRGIISGLKGSGYSPIFTDGRWELEEQQNSLQTLLERRVDGLIVVGGTLSGAALSKINEQVPVIVVARELEELQERCLFVDNQQAAYDATRFLIEAGHKQIAHITGEAAHQDTHRRKAGFVQAHADAGIELNPDLIVEGTFRRQSGILAVETLFTRGNSFSAIFAANDQMAFGARLALFRRGIRVPEDISLIGFDDQPDSAYMTPPLTTVRQPADLLGETAAAYMLQLIKKKPFTPPPFTTDLIIRESVALFR